MCAIFGIIENQKIARQKEIVEMSNILKHRGPDSRGFCSFDFSSKKINVLEDTQLGISNCNCLFGHNRLSIQDLTDSAKQPMLNQSNDVALIYNGELYNCAELKKDLLSYTFKSTSDTEVLLAYYLEFGLEKMLSRLDGMFAFAIIDSRLNKLFLARDRLGIKPLYYWKNPGKKFDFIFASEIKAFLCHESYKAKINFTSLYEFFTFGESLNPLLEDVKEVIPGEFLEINYKDFSICSKKYFILDLLYHPVRNTFSNDEILNMFSETLSESVKSQMISDVKVGCQLSGGIDSSLVTYFASKNCGLSDTVSIIPSDENFSEKSYIDYISKNLNINSHQFQLNDNFIEDNIERAVWHYESIITYHNIIALLKLSNEAKKYVTVLLSGEGADELFAGYTWFEDGFHASRYFQEKSLCYKPSSWPFLEERIRGLKYSSCYSEFAIKATDNINPDLAKKLFNVNKSVSEYNYVDIFSSRRKYFEDFSGSDFDKHTKYEISTRLRNLLIRQDKTSMANTIENRVPFLSNKMIDLAFSVPENVLIQSLPHEVDKLDSRVYSSLKGKFPLKMIAKSIYGDDFAFRRKVGFPLPFHKYLYSNKLKQCFYEDILPGIQNRGIMNASFLKQLYETSDLDSNRWNFQIIWKAYTFEIFCKLFLDKKNIGVLNGTGN